MVWPTQTATVVDAGLDYLRVTTGNCGLYEETVDYLLNKQTTEGPPEPRWSLSDGNVMQYVGVSCPALYVGRHADQGTLCQASGGQGDYEWLIGRECVRATRVDLHVTMELGCNPDDEILRLAHVLAERKRVKGSPKTLVYINGHGDGDTLYIGSRSSPQMIRVYNKSAERKDYEATILRVELELKKEAAEQAYALLETPASAGGKALALVAGRLGVYDVEAGWIHDTTANLRSATRGGPDDVKTWRWLRESVKPAIRRLLANGASEADVIAELFE